MRRRAFAIRPRLSRGRSRGRHLSRAPPSPGGASKSSSRDRGVSAGGGPVPQPRKPWRGGRTWRSIFTRASASPGKMTTASDHVAPVHRSLPPSIRSAGDRQLVALGQRLKGATQIGFALWPQLGDAILTDSTPSSRAAKNATPTIPIVRAARPHGRLQPSVVPRGPIQLPAGASAARRCYTSRPERVKGTVPKRPRTAIACSPVTCRRPVA
jgi:hypothetical protein